VRFVAAQRRVDVERLGRAAVTVFGEPDVGVDVAGVKRLERGFLGAREDGRVVGEVSAEPPEGIGVALATCAWSCTATGH
jgi:hypothetical protein